MKNVNQSKQTGLAAVEFVVVVPVLLFLMLATAEFGRMLYQYEVLTRATRDAARYASGEAGTGTLGYINDSTGDSSSWPGLQSDTANIALCGFRNCTGQPMIVDGLNMSDIEVLATDDFHVTVNIVHNFVPLFGNTLTTFGFGDPISLAIPLRSSVTMRAL